MSTTKHLRPRTFYDTKFGIVYLMDAEEANTFMDKQEAQLQAVTFVRDAALRERAIWERAAELLAIDMRNSAQAQSIVVSTEWIKNSAFARATAEYGTAHPKEQ